MLKSTIGIGSFEDVATTFDPKTAYALFEFNGICIERREYKADPYNPTLLWTVTLPDHTVVYQRVAKASEDVLPECLTVASRYNVQKVIWL